MSRRSAWRNIGVAAGALALAMAAGCSKKPGGQVLAVVDNHEITQQDLRAEAMAENINSKEALDNATPGMVRRLVDRTVLADYARKTNLDRGSEYVARRRQMEETLLAYLAVRKLVGNLQSPTPDQVKAYIAANPLSFAGRQRMTLDQIRFKTPGDPQAVKKLTQLGSLEAIGAKLKADGVPFTRVVSTFDSGAVDPVLAKQVVAVPNGEIFDLSTGGTSYINQVKGREPVTSNSADWQQQGLNAMRNKILSDALKSKLDKLKSSAKIQFDPAYAPKG